MTLRRWTLAASAALLLGCTSFEPDPLGTSGQELGINEVVKSPLNWGPGAIDPVFTGTEESGKAENVRHATVADGQRVHVELRDCANGTIAQGGSVNPEESGGDGCGFGGGGDGRAKLFVGPPRAAAPGQSYKGWLKARTVDSNNNGTASCETDGALSQGSEQFRAQLKVEFYTAAGDGLGSCYCNVCPREGAGHSGYCNTSQWAVNGPEHTEDGACRAPARTARVRFLVLALARDIQSDESGRLIQFSRVDGAGRKDWVEARGTAQFEKFVFARCDGQGNCNSPEIQDALKWY